MKIALINVDGHNVGGLKSIPDKGGTKCFYIWEH